MFATNKFKFFATVGRAFKANLNLSKICGPAYNPPCIKQYCTAFDSNSKWMLHDYLKIDKHKEVNKVWLRENCRCNECYNNETNQRMVLFYKQSPNSFEIESLKEAGEDKTVEVLWGDRHVSNYDKEWLRNTLTNDNLHFQDKKQFLWNANTILPYMQGKQIDYNDLLNDKAALKSACENLYEIGFLEIENAPKTMDATIKAAEKISAIRETYLGRVWDIEYTNKEDVNKGEIKDTTYSNDALGFHTDCNYLTEPPPLLVFQHMKVADEGGELVMLDGFHLADKLKRHDEQAYQILSEHLVNFSYVDEKRFFNETSSTIELNKVTGTPMRIRYNHYDRSAHHMQSSSIPGTLFYEALAYFSQMVEDPKNHLEMLLQSGTVLFVDNWRLVHARKAFKGTRLVAGCFMERDHWLSNLRIL